MGVYNRIDRIQFLLYLPLQLTKTYEINLILFRRKAARIVGHSVYPARVPETPFGLADRLGNSECNAISYLGITRVVPTHTGLYVF